MCRHKVTGQCHACIADPGGLGRAPIVSSRLIPLRCLYCGETWSGSRTSLGRTCSLRRGLPERDVVQCSVEELYGADAPEVF